MKIAVLGATGPTGLWVCRLALAAGHDVRAVSRRETPFPLPESERLAAVHGDALTRRGLDEAVAGTDAVLSVLGAAYTPRPVSVYSIGTRNIVEAQREVARGHRLVVVSSGLTYPPRGLNGRFSWAARHIAFPMLRHVLGRSLYADMRRMEEYLAQQLDVDWTVMRPGRLFDADAVSEYRLDPLEPAQNWTSRADLAAALVAELGPGAHDRQAVSPTTRR